MGPTNGQRLCCITLPMTCRHRVQCATSATKPSCQASSKEEALTVAAHGPRLVRAAQVARLEDLRYFLEVGKKVCKHVFTCFHGSSGLRLLESKARLGAEAKVAAFMLYLRDLGLPRITVSPETSSQDFVM